jgi:hypothetical protein
MPKSRKCNKPKKSKAQAASATLPGIDSRSPRTLGSATLRVDRALDKPAASFSFSSNPECFDIRLSADGVPRATYPTLADSLFSCYRHGPDQPSCWPGPHANESRLEMTPSLTRRAYEETSADLEEADMEDEEADFRNWEALNLECPPLDRQCFALGPREKHAANVTSFTQVLDLIDHWDTVDEVLAAAHIDSNRRFVCICGYWLGWTQKAECDCGNEFESLWTGYSYDDLDTKFSRDGAFFYSGEFALQTHFRLRDLVMEHSVQCAEDTLLEWSMATPALDSQLALSLARFDFIVARRGIFSRDPTMEVKEMLASSFMVALEAAIFLFPIESLDPRSRDHGTTSPPVPNSPVLESPPHFVAAASSSIGRCLLPLHPARRPISLIECLGRPGGVSAGEEAPVAPAAPPPPQNNHPAALQPADVKLLVALPPVEEALDGGSDVASELSAQETIACFLSQLPARRSVRHRCRSSAAHRRRSTPPRLSPSAAQNGSCGARLAAVFSIQLQGWAHVWTADERVRPPD